MSTQMQKEVKVVGTRGITVIDHSLGAFSIGNSALISPKVTGIMVACLDDGGFEADGHGLATVLFRDDGYPLEGDERATWMFYPNSQAAVCNIVGCIDIAIENSQDVETPNSEFVSVYALVWKNIIQGFFHEAHHANAFLQDGADLWDNAVAREKEEEKADEYARMMLFKLAKTMDLEPEFTEGVATMITERLMTELDLIKESLPALDEERAEDAKLIRWYNAQKWLMNHGGVYHDEGDTPVIDLKTFKEFLHVCSGDAENDPEWGGETIGKPVVLVQEPVGEDAHGNKVSPSPVVAEIIGDTYASDDSYDDMPYDLADDTDDDGFDAAVEAAPAGFQGVNQFVKQPAPAYQAPAPAYVPPTPVYVPPAQQAAPVAPSYVAPTNPAVVVGANAYPEIQLPAGVDAKSVVYGLYLKIFAHIFQGCQYNPTNPSMPFAGVGNIVTWLPLNQHESLFVKEMTCYSADGRGTWCPGTKVNGAISGIIIDKAKTLPAYELTLSTPNGTQIKRKFIPQNPNKMTSGQLTATAADAKAGNQIMWIIDPDTKAYSVRVYNGVVQTNVNGNWA